MEEITTNRSYESKKVKKQRADQHEIYCSFCRYHRGENRRRQPWKSWKRKRKTKYKIKNNMGC